MTVFILCFLSGLETWVAVAYPSPFTISCLVIVVLLTGVAAMTLRFK